MRMGGDGGDLVLLASGDGLGGVLTCECVCGETGGTGKGRSITGGGTVVVCVGCRE